MSILVLVAPTCFVSTAFAGDLGRDRSPEQNFGRFHRGAEASQEPGVFHRGVALFHPMASSTRVAGQFVPSPFSSAYHQLTDAQLDAIATAGFDFVRLTVDPGPFLQFQGAQRNALDDVLRHNVQMILARHIAVIVDFHPQSQEADYAPQVLVQSVDSPVFHSYCEMLARTAWLLADLNSNRVALELMNEPAVGWSRDGFAAWQTMAQSLYTAARGAAPRLMLVLSGGSGGNPQGLIALDPQPFANDAALIFTFHYYYPYEFTMQSETDSTSRSVLFDVPYPATARPLGDSLSALSSELDRRRTPLIGKAEAIARATAYLTAYRTAGLDRSSIQTTFDQVADWARAHDIPASRIFLGEFGVIRRYGIYHGARDNEREAWLRDVSQEAQEHGFFWSLWAYSGSGGMEITDGPAWTDIDPVTLRALGLRRR